MRICLFLLALTLRSLLAPPGAAAELATSLGPLRASPVVTGLSEPWGLAFLPGGGFLVTERDGTLWRFDAERRKTRVSGVPKVVARGQGGLLDVVVARDFDTSRLVFLSYSKPQRGGAGTAVMRARLSGDGRALTDRRVIFEMTPGSRGGRHFGSRIVETAQGTLFVTLGERGDRPSAQDLTRHNGSVVHITRDGQPVADAPFAGQGAASGIWSYGHRNPQGAALDGRGRLWIAEHGARGGDEINLVRRGANYGWPVISYGRHYTGGTIGEGTAKPGMEQPAHHWDPSIAPSGMMIYGGTMFPEWEGDIFVGSLKFDHLERLDLSGTTVTPAERISGPETARLRDVREAPDGSIWFLSVGNGAVYRLAR